MMTVMPTPNVPDRDAGPLVLLVSSNGAGMGHLTRLLAYGRHLGVEPTAFDRVRPAGARPYVLSLSQAAPLVARFDIPFEYLPSAGSTGMRAASWRRMFQDRLSETLCRLRPDVVVFDGTHPYSGMERAREEAPAARWVWSRRAMWRPGRNVDQLSKSDWFDVVLEPGDLAEAADRGATVGEPARRVGPVTFIDRDDLVDRDQARADLGLPSSGPLALVSLGAGNINDTSGDLGAVVAALGRLGVGVCVTHSEIALRAPDVTNVYEVRRFPLATHLRAFDLAVSAAGYNSFHELLRLGVPSLFIPNTQTSLDDQQARARHAHAHGWARNLDDVSPATAERELAVLLSEGPDLVARVRAADPGNGAVEAGALLRDLAVEVRS